MSTVFKQGVFSSAVAICVSVSASAMAQAVLEEIIVTARKATENLQEVPISVSTFSADSLASKGLSDVAQVGDFSPGVVLDFTTGLSGSSNSLTAYVRGIGQPDFALNFEPGVGVYVDGVYLARSVGSVVELLDVERIEILKGPQGTLFGRNTIGGAISIVTTRPGDEFDFTGQITRGAFDRLDAKATVHMPLVENKLLSTVSIASKDRDGYQRRIPFTGPGAANDTYDFVDSLLAPVATQTTESLGNANSDTVRARLLWLLNDDVDLTFSGDYTRARETSSASSLLAVGGGLAVLYNGCIAGAVGEPVCGALHNVNGDADPNNNRTPYDDRFLTGDIDTTYASQFGYSNLDAWGVSAELNWKISDSIDVKSITAHRELHSVFARDADGSPVMIDGPNFEMAQDQLSQEFQLKGLAMEDALKWLAGAYYFSEQGIMVDRVPLGGGLLQILGPNDVETEAMAVFGNASYSVTDQFSVNFGARYTEEEKSLFGAQRDLNALPSKLGVPPEAHPDPNDLTLFFPPKPLTNTFTNTLVKLGVDYSFTDELFAYASYSQGYKSGGWPTRLSDPALEVPGFDEETADAYEIGFKSEWLENRLRVNGAAFFTEYEDIQLTILRGIAPFTQNGGDAEIHGVELEFEGLATDSLRISGGIGYTDAQYVRLSPGSVVTLDDALMNIPKIATNLSVDYTHALGRRAEIHWHIDHVYKDKIANDPQNSPLLIQGSTHVVNASVTYVGKENWEIGLGVNNLNDERFIVAGFDQPAVGYTEATYNRPRQWWLTVRYKH